MANSEPSGNKGGFDLRQYRGLLIWIIFIAMFALIYSMSSNMKGGKSKEISVDELRVLLEQGKIASMKIDKDTYNIRGKFKTEGKPIDTPSRFTCKSVKEEAARLSDLAKFNGAKFKYEDPNPLIQILLGVLPYVLIFAIIYFLFFRQMRGMGGGGVLSFGKSKATRITADKMKKTFADVAGIDEAKDEVSEIIEFLRNPDRFCALGGRLPRGALLIGAPGTGKTLLAKAIAGEANVPFFSISGSDFVEMFVGVGASRVRDLFDQAKENAPCIIFLDEVDAVGRKRGTGFSGGHDEREQTLNAILVEMDGFETDQNIIVIAATNRPDVLDNALLRPGRFDRRIYVDLPDLKGRKEILEVHGRDITLAKDIDLQWLSRGTPGFSGADLENVMNEAALLAAMKNKKQVNMEDLEEARDKVRWGKEKRSRVMSEEDRRKIAFHEAGHALMNHLLEDVNPLHKVTIIQRGRALGATMQLPEKDEFNTYRKRIISDIKLLFGGRVAEEIFCDDISSGASNDIERATNLAHSMICEWGMNDTLGPIYYGEKNSQHYFGEVQHGTSFSEETSRKIDTELRKIIDLCYEDTRKIITQHKDELIKIAEALLEFEILSGKEVGELISGMSGEEFSKQKILQQEKEQKEEELRSQEREKEKEEALIEGEDTKTDNQGNDDEKIMPPLPDGDSC